MLTIHCIWRDVVKNIIQPDHRPWLHNKLYLQWVVGSLVICHTVFYFSMLHGVLKNIPLLLTWSKYSSILLASQECYSCIVDNGIKPPPFLLMHPFNWKFLTPTLSLNLPHMCSSICDTFSPIYWTHILFIFHQPQASCITTTVPSTILIVEHIFRVTTTFPPDW